MLDRFIYSRHIRHSQIIKGNVVDKTYMQSDEKPEHTKVYEHFEEDCNRAIQY